MNAPLTRLLLLEDDGEFARQIALFLEREGYSVTCEGDGNVGLETASSGKFDLCLLNVGLPWLDGFSIAQQLHDRKVEMPLIFFTSSPRQMVEARIKSLGLRVAYIQKPPLLRGLLCKIEEVLGGKGWL